jgi:hypothetical protein
MHVMKQVLRICCSCYCLLWQGDATRQTSRCHNFCFRSFLISRQLLLACKTATPTNTIRCFITCILQSTT